MRTTPGHPVNRAHPPGGGAGIGTMPARHGAWPARCRPARRRASTLAAPPVFVDEPSCAVRWQRESAGLERLPVTARNLIQVVEVGGRARWRRWQTGSRPWAIPAGGDRRWPPVPARGREPAAGVQPAVRRRAGAERGPGPLSRAGPRGGAELLGAARPAPAAGEPGQHLPRVHRRPRPPAAVHRRSDPVGRRGVLLLNSVSPSRRGARLAPRQGLGGGHRAGHPGARRPGARRWWRSFGAGTRATWRRCSPRAADRVRAPHPMSADRGFLARARSAGPTRCSRSWAGRRSTGSCPVAALAARCPRASARHGRAERPGLNLAAVAAGLALPASTPARQCRSCAAASCPERPRVMATLRNLAITILR